MQVTRQEAVRGIVEQSVVDGPSLPLRTWVTSKIDGSGLSSVLPSVLYGVKQAAQVLKEVWRLISRLTTLITLYVISIKGSYDVNTPSS